MDQIIPDLVELGITCIHIFQQAEVAKSRLNQKVIDRWQRIIEGSIKQCKRSWKPQIIIHKSIIDYLSYTSDRDGFSKYIAYHEGEALLSSVYNDKEAKSSIVTVIGGEKGLLETEFTALKQAGYEARSVGPFILKAMTAAVSCASIQSYFAKG